VDFARNFGHQTAITAGMDYSEGEAIVVIDADLQDPPELIPKMIENGAKAMMLYTEKEKKERRNFL